MPHTTNNNQIDLRLLEAIKAAEGGRRGREYGVLRVPAPTYADQKEAAAQTVLNTMGRYKQYAQHPNPQLGGVYSPEFLQYLSQGGPGYPGYAPVGAKNDPTGLNRYHAHNLAKPYYGLVESDMTRQIPELSAEDLLMLNLGQRAR